MHLSPSHVCMYVCMCTCMCIFRYVCAYTYYYTCYFFPERCEVIDLLLFTSQYFSIQFLRTRIFSNITTEQLGIKFRKINIDNIFYFNFWIITLPFP